MKKIFAIIMVLGVVVMSLAALTGCQQASSNNSTTAALPATTAQTYSTLGASLAQGMAGSMSGWAGTGGVSTFGIKDVSSKDIVVSGPTSGWYSIAGTETAGGVTIEVDLHAKVDTAGKTVDVYGTYKYSSAVYAMTLTYGSSSNPYHADYTLVSGIVTNVVISGSVGISMNVADASNVSHTLAMTFTTTSFSLPRSTVADYPTGTISISSTYDNVSQTGITLVFDGTAIGTFTYGGTSTSFTVYPS